MNDKSTLNQKPLFTVTWEDAEIEVEQFDDVTRYHPHPRVLMMGQSMDTALTLAGLNVPYDCIHLLCQSELEIALFDLKLYLINSFPRAIDRMRFLMAAYPMKQMKMMYITIEEQMRTSSRIFWAKNQDMIYNGIIYQDAWMKLFYKVKTDQKGKNKLKRIFNYNDILKIMDYSDHSCDNLFNSIEVPFYDYIKGVYYGLIKDHRNPYTHMIVMCQYDLLYYPRLFDSYSNIDSHAIISSRGCIVDYLLDTDLVEHYSLISVANLTDIVTNTKELCSLIRKIIRLLQKKGRAIFRRRNTDIKLYDHINKYMIILNHEFRHIDNTNLYSELIIATPRYGI